LRIRNPAAGDVIDFTGDTRTFTPELASTLRTLFTEVFGRRLGTKTDGTDLRAEEGDLLLEDGNTILLDGTDALGTDAGSNIIFRRDITKEGQEDAPLSSGTREVTLTSAVTMKINLGATISGAPLGPTLNLLPEYAFAVHPTTTSEVIPNYPDPSGRRATTPKNFSRDQYTIDQWGYVKINQVSAADGSIPISAYNTRVNIMPPSEIYISRSALINAFDNTFIKFDDGIQTFDEFGNPRHLSGGIYTSYDEDTISFDSSSTTLDTGA
jgi:hypothetical protein